MFESQILNLYTTPLKDKISLMSEVWVLDTCYFGLASTQPWLRPQTDKMWQTFSTALEKIQMRSPL